MLSSRPGPSAAQGERHDGVTGLSCLSTCRFITLGEVLVPLGVFRKVRMELLLQ